MKYFWFKRIFICLISISYVVGLNQRLIAQENNLVSPPQVTSDQEKLPKPKFSVYNIEAYNLFKSGQYSKAYSQAILAKEDAILSKDPYQLARALSNIASTTLYLGNTEKALDLYLESLTISRENSDIDGEESTLNNIAGIYTRLENYQEALNYFEQLPILNGVRRSSYQKAVAHIGLLNIYLEIGNSEEADRSLQILKLLFQEYSNPFVEFYFLLSYASFLEHEKKFQLVEQILLEADRLAIKNNFYGLSIIAQKNRARNFIETEQWNKATPIIRDAIESAQSQDLKTELIALYKLFVKIAKKRKQFASAIEKMELIDQLNVYISGEKVQQLAEITKIDRQMAETEEKLKGFQQKQKILSLELEKQHKDKLLWLGFALVIFLTIFFFVYRTNSHRAIRQQQKVNQKLTELDRVKDRILTNTSHELRTPLNGIIGLSDIILQDSNSGLKSESKDLLKLIKSSGEQLALVINDILEMSKLKSKNFTTKNSEFDLLELIQDVIAVCSPLADKKNIPILFVPEKTQCTIVQDKNRLQQVLFNIVGNAVKFTDEGEVIIQTEVTSDHLVVTVVDTGIGIPKDQTTRVFEGFEQVDSSNSREHQGSGLGLAISRDIAIAMGGKLKLESKIDQGTSVTITLPLRKLPRQKSTI